MPLEWLLAWWNAIYTLPLAVVIVLLAVTSILSLAGGALGEGGVEYDVDASSDVEVHAETDLHHDGAAGHAHDGHHGHGAGLAPALTFLGAGRAPLVMLLQILVLLWGLVGLSLHQTFSVAGPGALVWSVPIALGASLLGTRGVALLFGRFFKQKETYALGEGEIVGRTGRVVLPVTASEGTVHVLDQHGTLHRLRARAQHEPLDSGREIIIVGYDPLQRLYLVDDASAFVDRP